jgi:hypothetical protein
MMSRTRPGGRVVPTVHPAGVEAPAGPSSM